jgi:hypothetical protein
LIQEILKMKKHTFRLHLLAASFMLALLVCSSPAGTVEVGGLVRELVDADWIRADIEFAAGENGASKSSTRPVTTAQDAAGGCDGDRNGGFGFHVASGELDPWWQVDLGRKARLDRIVIHNRTDGGTAARTRNIQVLLSESGEGSAFSLVYPHDGNVFYGGDKALTVSLKEREVSARIIRLAVPGRCSLALDEVEVYAVDEPAKNIALGRPADQKSTSSHSTDSTKGLHRGPTSGGFLLGHTKQVGSCSDAADRAE